ncbi:unnamed protein product [Vitrella brassicaformis CCMP3155]|uniref:cAMP-dependent protein kinase regulatory subunit n=1 Tax=Vitrella brassicaformis (strain CCMP3155) TaxID=1169540 RepID=A0A0G4FB99_VITBC|nr:unnamed protein product [Vitrella brassicaformis CCMP3155]|eukprot:CEM10229.1 unnamed protein product [Vitrella brassicaformis CCMP3155]
MTLYERFLWLLQCKCCTQLCGVDSGEMRVKEEEEHKYKKVEGATEDPEKEADDEDEDEDEDDEVADLTLFTPANYGKKPRTSVSAEAYGEFNKKQAFTAPVYPKTDEQKTCIRNAINNSFLFQSLDEKDLKTVIDAFKEMLVVDGDVVITQGEDGDFLYLVETGEFIVTKKSKETGVEDQVASYEGGQAFGELALLYNCPRAATVKCTKQGRLWKLDRESFNNIVKDAAQKKREMYQGFLEKVELLKEMDAYERSKLADALKTAAFKDGEVIVKQGDEGDKFYIIEEGEAEAFKEGGAGKVMDYKKGDYFGELALIKNQPRAATVKAKGEVKCVTLDRKSFKRLLGPVEHILQRNADRYNTVMQQVK